MTRQRHSIDGFVSRRPDAPLGGLSHSSGSLPPIEPVARREMHESRPLTRPSEIPKRQASHGISRSEIDESLEGIDTPPPEAHRRKRRLSWKQLRKIIK